MSEFELLMGKVAAKIAQPLTAHLIEIGIPFYLLNGQNSMS
jgi:hypothetical protein